MFSPSSLLASSQHQNAHLPHIKPGDFDTSASTAIVVGSRKESRQSKVDLTQKNIKSQYHKKCIYFTDKKNDTHIKKPLNAFMLYMKEMRPVVQAECTLKESAAINQLLGRRVSFDYRLLQAYW